MKRFFKKKINVFFNFIKKNIKNITLYPILVIIIGFFYSFYISNKASFQSDWAAYYLFFDEVLKKGVFGEYFMQSTPILFQVFFYMLPVYLLFGISYKTFYFVIFLQTFINVFVFGLLLKKIFQPTKKFFPYTAFAVLLLTLTGPLLKIFDAVMFRKDIPILLLCIFYLYDSLKYDLTKRHKTTIFLSIFLLTMQAIGDPFVVFMILIPLIASNLIYYIFNKNNDYIVLKISFLSGICIFVASVIKSFIAKYVLNLYKEISYFVSIEKFPANLSALYNDLNLLLPFSGFFGKRILSFSNIQFFVNIFIIFVVFFAIVFSLLFSLKKRNPFMFFISSLPISSVLIYVLSEKPVSQITRYHIAIVFIIYIICFYFIKNISRINFKFKFVFYTLIIIHFFINSYSFLSILENQITNFKEYNVLEADVSLINLLNKKSLNKGFAGYWDSLNNTYYSRNKIAIRPILCSSEVVPFYWFSFKHWYKPEKNELKTFIYIDKTGDTYTSGCSDELLRNQFGKEDEMIEFEANKFLYIWNYDISSKINLINIKENELIK